MSHKSENPLVYSTEKGRIVPPTPQRPVRQGDGIVRLQKQVGGRRGKDVTVITGLDLPESALVKLVAEMKKRCACGGSVKNGVVEIQGDQRDLLKKWLEKKGYDVKLVGGS